MKRYLQRSPVLFLLALGGCAGLVQTPVTTDHYQCEGGKAFSLTVPGEATSATIEFDRMRFALRSVAPSGEAGERFSCDVMSVWRNGQHARVDMDGESPFRNCVRVP